MNPLVSIIIPCYNQEKFIGETLQSVSNQTYENWECIIIDDGSTDNSPAIIQDFIVNDSRFIYIYQENNGVSSARNLGLNKIKGQFIQFLDADDILDKQKLELSILELQLPENKDVKIVISNFKMISENSKEFYPPFCELTKESLSFENFLYDFFSIQLQCGLFDRSVFKIIRFPENLTAQEDWFVWIAIFKNIPNFIFIDIPLAFYRINPLGRMNTIGADDNQIKILDNLKELLTYEQFHKYSTTILSKYFYSNKALKEKIISIKKSPEFKTGFMIKTFLKKLGILYLFRIIFKKIYN